MHKYREGGKEGRRERLGTWINKTRATVTCERVANFNYTVTDGHTEGEVKPCKVTREIAETGLWGEPL